MNGFWRNVVSSLALEPLLEIQARGWLGLVVSVSVKAAWREELLRAAFGIMRKAGVQVSWTKELGLERPFNYPGMRA